MTGYWFKRKRYGWGWTPVTWQGWGVVVLLIVGVVLAALALGDDPSTGALIAYFAFVTLAVAFVIVLSIAKGPSPRWRWGRSADDDPREDLWLLRPRAARGSAPPGCPRARRAGPARRSCGRR